MTRKKSLSFSRRLRLGLVAHTTETSPSHFSSIPHVSAQQASSILHRPLDVEASPLTFPLALARASSVPCCLLSLTLPNICKATSPYLVGDVFPAHSMQAALRSEVRASTQASPCQKSMVVPLARSSSLPRWKVGASAACPKLHGSRRCFQPAI